MPLLLHRLLRLIAIALAFCASAGWAQDSELQFITRAWQSEDGLPGNVVRSVAQSVDGYLWVATAEGVVRFDGESFRDFQGTPDAALSRLPARVLFPLGDGSVWIATARGGLLRWDGRQLRALWDEPDSSVPSNQISQVLIVFERHAGEVIVVRGQTAFRWSGLKGFEEMDRAPLQAEIQAALNAAEARGRAISTGMAPHLTDRRGRIWTAPITGGLFVEETQNDHTAASVPVLDPGNLVLDLYEDREGNLWAATAESGLVQIRERRIHVIGATEGLTDLKALALLEDSAGAIWVGNKRSGIDRIAGKIVTHFDVGDGAVKRPVASICEDDSGVLWVATRDGSVFRKVDPIFKNFTTSAFPVSKVSAIALDRSTGRLWFAGFHVLVSLQDGKLTRYDNAPPISQQEFTALVVTEDGTLWAGTKAGTIWTGRDGALAQVASVPSEGRPISALHPGAGGIWATTLGAGLLHGDAKGFQRFDESSGLPDQRLTAVLDDGRGSLWVGSLGGIFSVRSDELLKASSTHGAPTGWIRFDRSDGLLSRECSGGFQPAAWRTKAGLLLFPTINGIAKINPAAIALNTTPPPVRIESIESDGRNYSPDVVAQVGPGRSRVEISFACLSFAPPEKVRFRARLFGLEKDWRDLGDRRVIQYESLPPGRYRFDLLAANGDNVWSTQPATAEIVVLPNFWETAWFRGLLILGGFILAILAGGAVVRRRLKERLKQVELQRAREAERARIAQDLHDDLGASLTEISMLASIASEENAMGISSPEALPEIAAKTQALVGALDEIVWAVNPRHDSVSSVVDYISAFAGDFLDNADVALRLDIPKELPPIHLAAERRHSLFLAVREALNNVVKHARASQVYLRIGLDGQQLRIAVDDDGTGMTGVQRSDSEGLRNMKSRLEQAGGTCTIAPRDGGGTSVQFTLAIESARPEPSKHPAHP